jgi:hypothetical protein
LLVFSCTAAVAPGDSAQHAVHGGRRPVVHCGTLATIGRNDAPYVSPFVKACATPARVASSCPRTPARQCKHRTVA